MWEKLNEAMIKNVDNNFFPIDFHIPIFVFDPENVIRICISYRICSIAHLQIRVMDFETHSNV